MTVKARLATPFKARLAALVALWLVAFAFDSVPLALTVIVLGIVEVLRGVRVTIEGGGFRPIRVSDFIDSAAADELAAWDAEQARKRSQW